jgi:hypothetical protein
VLHGALLRPIGDENVLENRVLYWVPTGFPILQIKKNNSTENIIRLFVLHGALLRPIGDKNVLDNRVIY